MYSLFISPLSVHSSLYQLLFPVALSLCLFLSFLFYFMPFSFSLFLIPSHMSFLCVSPQHSLLFVFPLLYFFNSCLFYISLCSHSPFSSFYLVCFILCLFLCFCFFLSVYPFISFFLSLFPSLYSCYSFPFPVHFCFSFLSLHLSSFLSSYFHSFLCLRFPLSHFASFSPFFIFIFGC